MGLQWIILTYVVATEAVVALLLTFPLPKLLKHRLASLISLILQPALFVVSFSVFQLLDICWKLEHRLMCSDETCTTAERDRYDKTYFKSQRNVILCAAASLLYWSIFRICRYYKELQHLEKMEKSAKDM